MEKRKLDKSRVYKLVKILVISITVISAVVALYTNYQTKFNTSYIQEKIKWLYKAPVECQKIYPDNQRDRESCIEDIYKIWTNTDDLANNSLMVAIFLPLIFFGGTRLYKYLFPVKTKE